MDLSLSVDKMKFKYVFWNINFGIPNNRGKKGEEGGYKENQNRGEKMKKKRKKSEVKIKRENIYIYSWVQVIPGLTLSNVTPTNNFL